jgi:FkbM family methyltransferase
MSVIEHLAVPMTRKGAFYARKLPWVLGLKSRFKTSVGSLAVPKSLVSPAIFYHLVNGDYESPERSLLEKYLSPDDRVIELGAGIGFLANAYGKRCPGQSHLAIEASPVMAGLARDNTRHLGNVEVLNALAMKAPQSVPFHMYKDFWASSIEPIHLKDPARRLVEIVQVRTVNLDDLIADHRATMLICDIEGGEDDLVRTFALNVPKVLMELHWPQLGISRAVRILKTFEERGYDLFGSPEVFIAIKRAGGA